MYVITSCFKIPFCSPPNFGLAVENVGRMPCWHELTRVHPDFLYIQYLSNFCCICPKPFKFLTVCLISWLLAEEYNFYLTSQRTRWSCTKVVFGLDITSTIFPIVLLVAQVASPCLALIPYFTNNHNVELELELLSLKQLNYWDWWKRKIFTKLYFSLASLLSYFFKPASCLDLPSSEINFPPNTYWE